MGGEHGGKNGDKATPDLCGHVYVASGAQTRLETGCRRGAEGLPLGCGVRVHREVPVRRQDLSRCCPKHGVKILEPREWKVGCQDVGGDVEADVGVEGVEEGGASGGELGQVE